MVLIILVLFAMAWAKPAPTEVKYYASKYDHIDVEAILNNRRMVKYYSACLLSKGACPPEGVDLKRILPEALHTNCGRCSEKQATVTLRAIKRLRKEYPKIWSQLSEKWDPDGVYVEKFISSFGTKVGPSKTSQGSSNNKFDSVDDQATENAIDVVEQTQPATTNQQPPSATTQQPTTTSHKVTITATNISKPSSTISTTNESSSSSTTTTTTTSSTRLPLPIPGLLPINTFFTNPPIPIRPIVNLNIGANIGATVKAIKQVEKVVAGIALEKIGMLKNMLLLPWRRTRRKRS